MGAAFCVKLHKSRQGVQKNMLIIDENVVKVLTGTTNGAIICLSGFRRIMTLLITDNLINPGISRGVMLIVYNKMINQ